MSTSPARLGILVGGGPAPGINSVISAVTIEASNRRLQVLGIYDGFEHLIAGRPGITRWLTIPDVSRIHYQGGSILRTSRANPTRQTKDLEQVVHTLQQMGVRYLVTIGGDDTAFAASEVARTAGGSIRVAHVPKTIDNDLPLPGGMPTFGYETARHVGTETVLNLMEDSRTTNRWYFVVVMGRSAGHLALGIGKSAGATLTLIPEEFSRNTISLDEISRILEGAILKRRVMGQKHGLAVIAEGIGAKLDPEELTQVPGVAVDHDPYGHIRLGEIPLATILRRGVQRRFSDRDEQLPIVEATLGYELRSAPPIPYDMDYTRTLGYAAVQFLLSEAREEELQLGGLVCLDHGHSRAIPFLEFRDTNTGRTKVRTVDLKSEHYISTRQYMIRLEPQNLTNPEMRAKLAEAAQMSPVDFGRAFACAVGLTEQQAGG